MVFAAVSTNSGLWQFKAEDQPIWATDYCRKLFNIPKGTLLTFDRLSATIHPEDRPIFTRAMRSAIRLGIPIDIEFRIVSQDGPVRWVAAKGQPFHQNDRKSTIINGLFTDVTALKEAEQEADLHRREVTHLMRQSVMNELSGTIAHELNQPLTAIMSNAEAAQDLLSDQEGRGNNRDILGKIGEILKDIMAEDERAADVISRVRQLLKKGDSKRETITINKLIKSTLALLHGELVKRKIVADVDCALGLPSVSVDFVQLQQVLINLLVNAMDAMSSVPPSEREIRIRAISERDQVKIIISDRWAWAFSGHP